MRNLHTEPAWREEDLGLPLPDDRHAVSVCLPTWDAVIGYEENLSKVTNRMQLGYPRFFRHPAINRLFTEAQDHLCSKGEKLVVFPNTQAAQRAQHFVEKRINEATRIASYADFQCLITPEAHFSVAMEYWRYTGEIVSSRRAQDFFEETPSSLSQSSAIREVIAHYSHCPEDNIYLYENGMSAAYAAFRAIYEIRGGKKTLQLEFPYVDTLKIQQHFGAGVVYLNECDGEPMQEAIQRIKAGEFAAVFCEIPSNPLLRTIDIEAVSQACREGGVFLIIDDTICSSYNVDVTPYADIITTSLTKWFSGVGNVMGGAIQVTSGAKHADLLNHFLKEDCPQHSKIHSSDEAVLLDNMKGFSQRMQSINANGKDLAELLANNPAIEQVWHPIFTTKDNYEKLMKPSAGYGGLISFTLKSSKKAQKFFDALKVSKGPSLGTEFTLASPYTLLAHYDELDWVENCGVSANLIRISVGTEPLETLKNTFTEALEHL